jgi:hypothetical protein
MFLTALMKVTEMDNAAHTGPSHAHKTNTSTRTFTSTHTTILTSAFILPLKRIKFKIIDKNTHAGSEEGKHTYACSALLTIACK